jgi:hypothetical protein
MAIEIYGYLLKTMFAGSEWYFTTKVEGWHFTVDVKDAEVFFNIDEIDYVRNDFAKIMDVSLWKTVPLGFN